jgi:membrane protease YdiL (CAAX protease family)
MNTLTSFVKQYRLAIFLVLTYALSWWPALLYARGNFPAPVAAFGPFLAALIVLGLTEGRSGVKTLLRRMVRWRVGLQWYLIALGLPILMSGLASYLNVLLGAPAPSADHLAGWPSIFTAFIVALLIPGLGGAWEEPGWRGFAVHRLEERWSRLWALLPLWAIIVFWHLPLFLTGDGGWPDVVNMIGGVIIYTWLYHRSGNSVLLVMIIHAMNNAASGEYTSTLFDGVYATQLAWMKALVWGIPAVIVIVAYWRWWTEKSPLVLEEPEQAIQIG